MFITKYWYQTCVHAEFDSQLRHQFHYIWSCHRHSWWRTGSEGRGQSRWWLSMRSWLGRKGDRYLDKKGLSYGCIQTFILFFCVKIVQGYGEIFCCGLSCNRFMKTWIEHNANFNDFDRIWSLGCWDNGTVIGSVSLLPLCRWSAGCSRWCGYKPWGLSSHRSQLTNDQQSAKPEGKKKYIYVM